MSIVFCPVVYVCLLLMCVYSCVCRAKLDIRCLPWLLSVWGGGEASQRFQLRTFLGHPQPYSLRHLFTDCWFKQTAWTVSPPSHLPNTRCSQPSTWVVRIKLQFLLVPWCFPDWTVSPAPLQVSEVMFFDNLSQQSEWLPFENNHIKQVVDLTQRPASMDKVLEP